MPLAGVSRTTLLAACLLALLCVAPAHARTVRYAGAQLEVPSSWPVVRVGERTCVRFDRHAVYLGTQSARAVCPAHLAGQTTAVQIERSGRVIRTGDPRAPVAKPRARAATASPRRAGPGSGRGFDTCAAPSADVMATWKQASPYSAVGVYVGGVNRACSQPNLSAAWVSTVYAQGWSIIPTYVGLQAPCGNIKNRIDPANAAAQGTQAADDAVAQASAVGFAANDPIYFDMEAFPTSDQSCVDAVRAFLQAWTVELHARGWTSGVYGSSASTIAVLAQQWGTAYAEPDDIWYANWDNRAQTTGDPYFSDATWPSHQRLHQYQGGHQETYGGQTINIDSSALDGAVAQPAAPYAYALQRVDAFADAAATRPLDLNALRAGQDAWIRVTAANTGSQPWESGGSAPVRLGTWNPQDRTSAFATADWLNPVRAAGLNEPAVAPGATGTFAAHLRVPQGTTVADERFNLVADGVGFMADQGIDVHLQVAPYLWTVSRVRAYADRGLRHRARMGRLRPGQDVYIAASVVNVGSRPWPRTRVRLGARVLRGALVGRRARLSHAIAPGRRARFVLHVTAPRKRGSYRRRYGLVVAGKGFLDAGLVVRARVR